MQERTVVRRQEEETRNGEQCNIRHSVGHASEDGAGVEGAREKDGICWRGHEAIWHRRTSTSPPSVHAQASVFCRFAARSPWAASFPTRGFRLFAGRRESGNT